MHCWGSQLSGLHAFGFHKRVDRVIAVGYVIDQSPGVLDSLKLLGEPWLYGIQSNQAIKNVW